MKLPHAQPITSAEPMASSRSHETPRDGPPSTQTEWEQLRIRVIALENLVITLLAEAPLRQRTLANEMAAYISPRPGCTPHPLTLRAADEMRSLVDRAERFRAAPGS